MYSFEGKFRRTPVQSLGGASQTEQKQSLIKKFQDKRNKREDERQKQYSAIKIQSCFRSYISRKFQMGLLREEFDLARSSLQKNTSVDDKTLYEMIYRLSYFYKPHDSQRLIFIFQELSKKGFNYIKSIDNKYCSGLYHLKQILHLSIKYLKLIAASNEPIALPMRMLEIYLSPINNNSRLSGHDSNFSCIINHIVKSGYFECLKDLLNYRVPSSIERNCSPLTPIASSIFNLIMIPVQFTSSTSNKELRNFVLKSLCEVFLCEKFSEQVELFLIPSLTNFPQFPFEHLIDSLISSGKAEDELYRVYISSSPYLLLSLLKISQNSISGDMKSCIVIKYIKLLDILLSSLIPLTKRQYSMTDSDNEEDDIMEYEDENMVHIREEILQQLNSTCQIKCFINCLSSNNYNIDIVESICSICYKLMAVHMVSINKMRLLYTLSLHTPFLYNIWYICKALCTKTCTRSTTSLLSLLGKGLPMYEGDKQRFICIFYVFCAMFSHSLTTLHDAEFYGDEQSQYAAMPFTLEELVPMSYLLREACLGILDLAYPDIKHSINDVHVYQNAIIQTFVDRKLVHDIQEEEKKTWICLFKVVVVLVKQLYNRDSRRRYCPKFHWLSNHVTIQSSRISQIYQMHNSLFSSRPISSLSSLCKTNFNDERPPLANRDVRNLVILTELPFVVTFAERVKILQRLIMVDKEENQSEITNFLVGPSINVVIRRNYVYEDAFDKLSPDNEPNLKLKMRVQLKNAAGLDEAGIDGGGVFREFLTLLLKTAFDPNRGFFQYTTNRLIYPNPHASQLEENYTKHCYFIGRMLGKALYENMLVELPFASFFLVKILSNHGFNLDIHYLQSLDPVMYKNLLSLKNYERDVSELGLDFSIIDNSFGENKIIELKAGGRTIPVTNENKIEYVHLMADYKVNKQIHSHCAAFRKGMADVISLEWLQMFDHHELQVLISGSPTPIDIVDLRQNTSYSGGFSETHPVIELFWKVVASFTDQQKSQLLKFVTSCSQQPLLGFKDLYPQFCIHDAGTDLDRLPTASTCMNLLKLPHFTDESLLRNKLLYAVESNAGFELS